MDDLEILSFALGPAQANAYLLGDRQSGRAVVIDPAWDGAFLLETAAARGWRVGQIWLTHAHFDHLGGAAALADGARQPVPVALHPADHPLWQMHGGAAPFGYTDFDPGPEPTVDLFDGMELRLGPALFTAIHAPGHTPGHMLFYCQALASLFCGDLIFAGSVGRTDLPGGNGEQLMASIQRHVLSLPDETRLLPGHGPETTVGRERASNPFLRD
ncbi:MAG TPA: MBL fold metallo-hydrolase [Anaerolineales bacterium]